MSDFTPEDIIKMVILTNIGYAIPLNANHDSLDDLWEMAREDNDAAVQEEMDDLRSGEEETGQPPEFSSRHYEHKGVAAKGPNGQWVGWSYWYGGGKHSEPEAMPWMSEAYFLDCVEEEKTVIVRSFSKVTA